MPHFESKTKVDEYIRQDKELLAKTTFLFITYYATNILMPMFTPNQFVSRIISSPQLPKNPNSLAHTSLTTENHRQAHSAATCRRRHPNHHPRRYNHQHWNLRSCHPCAAPTDPPWSYSPCRDRDPHRQGYCEALV